MKVRKLVETTETREVIVNRLVTRDVIVQKKVWSPVTESREVKVKTWIETEVPCANPHCGYPEAKHYAMGFCQHCYLADRMRMQRGNNDTIEAVQAEIYKVKVGERLPEGLFDRMKKLGLENFDTKPKPKPEVHDETV